MNLKEWILHTIEEIKNREDNSKNIDIIIKTRLDKISNLEKIYNLLITNHTNIKDMNIEKLCDNISKYNSYKLNIEEMELLKINVVAGNKLNNYEEVLLKELLSQILTATNSLKLDINNLVEDKEVLSIKYSNIDKYYSLLNKLNMQKELITESDLVEEMLKDPKLDSKDKLSNMEYILDYNESIVS